MYKARVRFLPATGNSSTRINRIIHYTQGFIKSSRRKSKVKKILDNLIYT